MQRQTSLTLRAQLVDLRAEVEQAVKAYQTAYVTVTTDDPTQLQAATNVRDTIKMAYELGGRPLIEVLDAQRAYRVRTDCISQASPATGMRCTS